MRAERKDRLLILGAGSGILFLLTLLYVFQPGFLHQLDLKLYDQLLRGRGTREPSGRVVIVDLDERSLAQYGQWPWPRYRVALLLGRLREAGAAVVGLDILLAEPDRTSPAVLQEELRRDLGLEVAFSGLPGELRDHDALLASVLGQGPYVLSLYFDFLGNPAESDSPPPPLNLSVLRAGSREFAPTDLLSAKSMVPPLPCLSAACGTVGFFNTISDQDGIIRRVPLLIEHRGAVYPSLAVATLMKAAGGGSPVLKVGDGGPESLRIAPSLTVPVDSHGRALVNFLGPARTFPSLSAADVLEGKFPGSLQGAVVLVGTSVAGLRDNRTTPFGPDCPGVEIHATVIDNMLTGQFITIPDWAPGLEATMLWVTGLAATLCIAFFRPMHIVAPLLALAAGMWWGADRLLVREAIVVSPLYPYLALGLAFAGLSFLKLWGEERRRRFIHDAFSHYVSPTVVGEIMRSPDAMTLSGEEKEVTILFSDIRGFTALSEKLTPTQVTQLLNAYFTPMTRIITAHQGTVDKFIGDALMAFWNAPLNVPGHQTMALRAALEMLRELDRLNEDFVARFGSPVRIGIGVHCGRARVGNMGSEDLFDYTLIGDNVNLTSRMEGLTKHYGLSLLLTGDIRSSCAEGFTFLEVDRVRVKGRDKPVTIHTAFLPGSEPDWLSARERYEKGLEEYRRGRFREASAFFCGLVEEYPGQKLFGIYADRCGKLACSPAGETFDGVYSHKEK
jgi:adenylate cyclase